MQVKLLLNIEPKALARARASNGRMYYTQAKQDEMNELSWAILEAINKCGVNKGLLNWWVEQSRTIEVEIEFGLRVPASLSKKKRMDLINTPHTKKPDLDNLIKNVFDRGNGVLWKDDKYIHTMTVKKVWRERGYIKIVVKEEAQQPLKKQVEIDENWQAEWAELGEEVKANKK